MGLVAWGSGSGAERILASGLVLLLYWEKVRVLYMDGIRGRLLGPL